MNNYKLELFINLIDAGLPIGLSVCCDKTETENNLKERIDFLNKAISWLNVEKQNVIRIFHEPKL